jgi:hypothetical protein
MLQPTASVENSCLVHTHIVRGGYAETRILGSARRLEHQGTHLSRGGYAETRILGSVRRLEHQGTHLSRGGYDYLAASGSRGNRGIHRGTFSQ